MNIIEYAMTRKLAGGGSAPAVIEPLSITTNGLYTPPDGVDGYSPVTVSVARDDQTDIEEQFIRAIERDSSKPVTELPAGLTKIGDNAFYKNDYLTLTSLPDGVTSIGASAFASCVKLALTSLPDGVTSIGASAFANCYAIKFTSLPDGVTNIGDNTFKGCINWKLASLPDGVTNIGTEAFSGCSNLAIPYLPRSLRTIGLKAFSGCQKLAISSIPSGVTEIGNQAFYACPGLTEIVFEGKPTLITGSAFSGCTNLLTINVPWAEGEVANAPWGATNATINYNFGKEPEQPDSNTVFTADFEDGTTDGWENLWGVVKTVEAIPEAAYSGNYGLHVEYSGSWQHCRTFIETEPGKTYKLTAMGKLVSGPALVILIKDGSDRDTLASKAVNSSDWESLSVTFEATEESTIISIMSETGGSSAYIDDIVVTEA